MSTENNQRDDRKDGSDGEQASEAAYSYEVSPDESISEGIVRAVAAWQDVAPARSSSSRGEPVLDPLYTVVDPDAIDSIFRAERTDDDAHLSFYYQDGLVTVSADGSIRIQPADEHPDGSSA